MRRVGLFDSGEDIDWEQDPRHAKNVARKAAKKREHYRPYVEDQDLLHVGAGGGQRGRADDDGEWFHSWLDEVASKAVGIDTDAEAVKSAREEGYDVRRADATTFDLNEDFDVVVTPNVLEHVANPGRLLNRSRDHLRPDGRLLLTTDVPVSYWYLARELLGGRETHPEHVHSWGAPELRNIVERCGFRVEHHERYWFRRVGMSPADRLFAAIERVLNRIPVLDRGVAVQHFLVGQRADYGSARRPNGSSPSSKEATE